MEDILKISDNNGLCNQADTIFDIIYYIYKLHIFIYWYYSCFWFLLKKRNKIYKNIIIKTCNLKIIGKVLFFQFFYIPCILSVFYNLYISQSLTSLEYLLSEPNYDISEFLTIIYVIFLSDSIFYNIHRLLHTRYFYRFHLLHHTINDPSPWVALYSSVFENVFLNIFPVLISPYILKMKLYYYYFWISLATLQSTYSHTKDSRHHYLHHKYKNCNYGIIPLSDILGNTFR